MSDTIKQAVIDKDGDRAITITRDFAAPVGRVFAAMQEPELIAQWIGPDRLDAGFAKMDALLATNDS